MTLNVSVMRTVTKQHRGFCYKVALYLSYRHIKFGSESLRISSIISDYPASDGIPKEFYSRFFHLLADGFVKMLNISFAPYVTPPWNGHISL